MPPPGATLSVCSAMPSRSLLPILPWLKTLRACMRVSRLLGATLRVRREKKAGVVMGAAAADAAAAVEAEELEVALLLALLLELLGVAVGALVGCKS